MRRAVWRLLSHYVADQRLSIEVPVEPANEVRGVILCDQLRCVDWRARRARFITGASANCLDEVLAKIEILLRR